MKYTFAAFDLDGTLLNSKKEISLRTKKALFSLQKLGVNIILASGRHPSGIIPIAEELELSKQNGYILAFNGGKIIKCATGQTLYSKPLEREVAKKIICAAKALNLCALTYTDCELLTETPEDHYVKVEAKLSLLPIKAVLDLGENLPSVVDKLLLVATPQLVSKALPILKEKFRLTCSICCSTPYFIEVTALGVDKAVALDALLDKNEADKTQLVCFGDGQNDISMLQFAELGVAMENAPLEVQAAADIVTKSCDCDGVAIAIEEIWLLAHN